MDGSQTDISITFCELLLSVVLALGEVVYEVGVPEVEETVTLGLTGLRPKERSVCSSV